MHPAYETTRESSQHHTYYFENKINMFKILKTTIFAAGLLLTTCCQTACNNGKTDENTPAGERLELLDAKIKKHPKDAELYYQRGTVLLGLKRVKPAIADFKKACELDKDEPRYFTALGDAYFSSGDAGESYKALEKALQIAPDNMEALLKMSEITFYSKDYDRAMETLNKVTEKDPNNKTAFFMKGFIYKENGDTANAVTYFHKLIELYPDYAPAYEEMGVLYANHKNPKLAEEYLATALRLDSTNTNAMYALAMLYQDAEEVERANDMYVKILERDPGNAFAWHNRGYLEMVYYQDYDAAIDFFTKAIEADNLYVDAHVNRGIAYEQKGDRKNARECYETALQIDPTNTKALQGKARMK